MAQARQIAEKKMPDLNAASIETATSMICGSARSMGIEVVDYLCMVKWSGLRRAKISLSEWEEHFRYTPLLRRIHSMKTR